MIDDRPRSKHQTVGLVRLGRVVIQAIMIPEILHKVALKESCMTLLPHKISLKLRVLSYNTTRPCNYLTEQLTARFLRSRFAIRAYLMLQDFTRSATEPCQILLSD